MQPSAFLMIVFTLLFVVLNTGMGRHSDQYDIEARATEKSSKNKLRAENPASGIAQGVKSATVDSTSGFISETREGPEEQGPVIGTLEGARKGTGAVLDKTVRGAVKVATLGQGDIDTFEVREPEHNSGETTKITIKLPGT